MATHLQSYEELIQMLFISTQHQAQKQKLQSVVDIRISFTLSLRTTFIHIGTEQIKNTNSNSDSLVHCKVV